MIDANKESIENKIFEDLVEGIIKHGYASYDDFIPKEVIVGLRANLIAHQNQGDLKRAGIGNLSKFQTNNSTRCAFR